MKKSLVTCFVFVLTSVLLSTTAFASNNSNTIIREIQVKQGVAVSMDILSYQLKYNFDVSTKTATGFAHIEFEMTEAGFPFFLMKQKIANLAINGTPAEYASYNDGFDGNGLKYIPSTFQTGAIYTMDVDFNLDENAVSFSDSGVQFLTTMSDLNSMGYTGNYFELYAPSNYEDDQFPLSMEIELTGATNDHLFFANGNISLLANERAYSHWMIQFPEYFCTSSFYVHLTDKKLYTKELTLHGMTKDVPAVVYSENKGVLAGAAQDLANQFAEIESKFGPYSHATFIGYITNFGGGMEHVGATITDAWALSHELFHSWFARGVMPTDGRSGWIDEAIASWRDDSYPTGKWPYSRGVIGLGNKSALDPYTDISAYNAGKNLISDLNALMKSRGTSMQEVLNGFHADYQYTNITNEIFQSYLEASAGVSIAQAFDDAVYGKAKNKKSGVLNLNSYEDENQSAPLHHPRPFTADEIKRLR